MKASGILSAALCSTLAACLSPIATVNPGHRPALRAESALQADATFTLAQMGEFIEQTVQQPPSEHQAEIERFKNEGTKPASDRLKLAYLLSLENATADELAQSSKLLTGLDADFSDQGIRLYVRLLQRTVTSEAACAREMARGDELEQKLKQIKKLELDLIQRNESSTPPTTPAQSPAK